MAVQSQFERIHNQDGHLGSYENCEENDLEYGKSLLKESVFAIRACLQFDLDIAQLHNELVKDQSQDSRLQLMK